MTLEEPAEGEREQRGYGPLRVQQYLFVISERPELHTFDGREAPKLIFVLSV